MATSDLTPEKLAEWDADAQSRVAWASQRCPETESRRIVTLVRALRDEQAARQQAEAALASFKRSESFDLADMARQRDEALRPKWYPPGTSPDEIIARCEAAERELADLRARIEALADEWESPGPKIGGTPADAAAVIRARLLPPTDPAAPCGSTEAHEAHPMPCDSGCQPDWHRFECAIYDKCPGLAATTDPTKEDEQ